MVDIALWQLDFELPSGSYATVMLREGETHATVICHSDGKLCSVGKRFMHEDSRPHSI